MTPPAAMVAAISALPEGTFHGAAFDRRYLVTRSLFNAGRSEKLVAEALDGSDYVSLNLYHLAAGPALYPCEMPAEKVIAFVCALKVAP